MWFKAGMSKKPAAKSAPKLESAPGKRSKVKLAVMALAPLLVLGGGGYAGWTMFLAGPAHSGEGAPDEVKVAAIPPEVAAETSLSHSFALATLIAPRCGAQDVTALKAATDKEAETDGVLVNLSWQAAARRTVSLTEKSCDLLMSEVADAEAKARALAPVAKEAHKEGGEAKAEGH